MNGFMPEGCGFYAGDRASREEILSLLERGETVEARATLCDHGYNLHVTLGGGLRGIIPREESQLVPEGEKIKDIAILTRVGRTVAVKLLEKRGDGRSPFLILSRRAAQLECEREYLSGLVPGDIIPGRVTHLEGFGAFIDVGCGICSLLSIDAMSVSRISHPSARMSVGDLVYTVVRGRDERGRLVLTAKELFGSWEENALRFKEGQTVEGIIRSIESYGIFVELTPNLAGLAEWRGDVAVGQVAAVFIKAIIPEKMKVKLIIIDTVNSDRLPEPPEYFIDPAATRHLDVWRYSPARSRRRIESVFI